MIGTSQLINTFSRPCFTDTTDIFKDGSGVALHGLDYDASDAGGASGKFGEAAIFNGSSSVVTINSTFDFSSSFSISMWFNADTLPSGTYIPLFFTDGYGGPSSDYGIALYLYGNTIKPWIDRQGTYTNIFTAGTLSTGTWYHVVLNRDYNSKWELFLNGLSLGTYTGVGLTDNYTPSSFSTIGKHSTASMWFDGKIDQVRIFNTAPIQSQVTQLFQENSSTVGTHLFGCVANYNLDGSAKESMGTTAYDGTETDITYRYDGTPTAVDFGVGGKSNYGARFNGSSSYINLPNLGTDLSGSNTRTLSAWVKLDSNPSVYSAVVSYGGAGSLQSFGIYMSSTGTPRISYYNLNWDTSTSLTLGNWYHIVGIYKGGNVETSTNTELYINGQIQTLTITNSLNLTGAINTSNTNYAIGYYRASPSGSYFNGDIDQVRVFNKALSSAEVGKLYGNGAGEIACAYTSTTGIVNYPSDTTPVAYYKLDNSSEDYSTGGNDGTATNVEYKFGRYGQAAVFNGSSSAIVLPNDILDTSEHSISLWFNLDDTNGIQTVLEMDYENRILFRAVSTDSNLAYIGSVGYFDHGIPFSAGQWYHLVITFSAGNPFKIYVDGVLSYTGANSNIKSQDNDNILGASNSSGANGVDGKIDQVRIYSTALTSSQVTELYNEKPEVDTSNFKAVLYEGNGGTQYISNVGMDLETDGGLVWIKNRDVADAHVWFDSVRGATKYIMSNLPALETTQANTLDSFEANGFFLGSDPTGGAMNANNESYVSWVWKGGGEAVQNNDGTIQGANCMVSANTEAGFSIVKYTGNSTAGATVGHGLSSAPDLIIVKLLDSTKDWYVFSELLGQSGGEYQYLELNTNDDATTFVSQEVWNGDLPTSDLFTLTGGSADNLTNNDYIAYCWHSVAGYSKIGSYQGNAGTKTIYTTDDDTSTGSGGFEPSFVLMKNFEDETNSHWVVLDNARSTTNPREDELYPGLPNANQDLNRQVNFVSNGFQLTSSSYANRSGIDYIYMAFK